MARQQSEGLRVQHLQQGLGGVKDVKLLGREFEFLAQYRAHLLQGAHVTQLQATLLQLPRLWLETAGQQLHRDTDRLKELPQRGQVLLGQDLGRGHHD